MATGAGGGVIAGGRSCGAAVGRWVIACPVAGGGGIDPVTDSDGACGRGSGECQLSGTSALASSEYTFTATW
jgi:hypothetical protein